MGDGGRRVIEPNFIARPYRGVSVQDAPSLEPEALLAHVRSRRVYRRTEFIVAVRGDERALVQLEREDGDEILVGVRDAWLLAAPDQVAFIVDHEVDTGNASQLARAAKASGRDALVYVVEGRFQHVNFIYAPAPARIRVVEVVPPHPPKLLDMARTVIDYDEELPPLELDFVAIDLRELAAAHPADHYLFPCRCAGLDLDATVDFLDAGPPEAADVDAGRLRALAPDPCRAVRPRPARAGRLLPAPARGRARPGADPAQVLPARARDRARGRADDGAVGREPRGGPARAAVAGGGRRMSGIDLADSVIYGHLWATEEARALLGDEGRTRAWVEIIAALAVEQGALGLIPAAAADELRPARRTTHSTSSPSASRPARPAIRRSA